ncbi:MAG: hypothetical protein PHQ14_09420, partial [Chromatiales bacterium]|nr:hypothetical protein [Chromatiales bacterium]
MPITTELPRLTAAAGVLAGYAALCAAVWAGARRCTRARADTTGDDAVASVLVAYASQTGFAESLADEAAQALRAAGLPVRLLPLGQLGADELA